MVSHCQLRAILLKNSVPCNFMARHCLVCLECHRSDGVGQLFIYLPSSFWRDIALISPILRGHEQSLQISQESHAEIILYLLLMRRA